MMPIRLEGDDTDEGDGDDGDGGSDEDGDEGVDACPSLPSTMSLGTCELLGFDVTGGDTDSIPGSDSRPLARQGTVTAALWLM